MLKAHTKKWQNKKHERCALIGRAACQREIETEKGSVQGVYVCSNCCCKDLPDDRQEKRRVKCRQAKNICTTMEATAAEKSKGNVLKTSEKMEKVGLA